MCWVLLREVSRADIVIHFSRYSSYIRKLCDLKFNTKAIYFQEVVLF